MIDAGYQCFAKGDYTEAGRIASLCLSLDRSDPAANLLMGRVARIMGEPDLAENIFSELIRRYTDQVELRVDLALALRDLTDVRAAMTELNSAWNYGHLSVATERRIKLLRGDLLMSIGDVEGARNNFLEILTSSPSDISALRGLVLVSDSEASSTYHSDLRDIADDSSRSIDDRAKALYSLVHLSRNQGNDDEFIAYVFRANKLQRSLVHGAEDDYGSIFARATRCSQQINSADMNCEYDSNPAPIFVLGMPRSGTTLMEALLALEPNVHAGGELNFFNRSLAQKFERVTSRPFPEDFGTTSRQHRETWAKRYLQLLRRISASSKFVIDKTPGNFHCLGVIASLFPNAKFIHMSRSPLDNCFSILQYPFESNAAHTCDMQLLGYYYGAYRKLMTSWIQEFPGRILTIDYESLVNRTGEVMAGVYAFCGLRWCEDYLVKQGNVRGPVRTFSAQQVRKKIYTSSLNNAARFRSYLTPLCQALEENGVQLE